MQLQTESFPPQKFKTQLEPFFVLCFLKQWGILSVCVSGEIKSKWVRWACGNARYTKMYSTAVMIDNTIQSKSVERSLKIISICEAWLRMVKHMRGWQSIAEHGNVPIRDHLAAIHPACQPRKRSGRQEKDFKIKERSNKTNLRKLVRCGSFG